MTAPHAPNCLPRGMVDGALRPAFRARETGGMIRGALYGTTRHKMLGVIDTRFPASRMIEEFCLQALSLDVEGQAKRQEGGRR